MNAEYIAVLCAVAGLSVIAGCIIHSLAAADEYIEDKFNRIKEQNAEAERAADRIKTVSGECKSAVTVIEAGISAAEDRVREAELSVRTAEQRIIEAEGNSVESERLIEDCFRILDEAEKKE